MLAASLEKSVAAMREMAKQSDNHATAAKFYKKEREMMLLKYKKISADYNALIQEGKIVHNILVATGAVSGGDITNMTPSSTCLKWCTPTKKRLTVSPQKPRTCLWRMKIFGRRRRNSEWRTKWRRKDMINLSTRRMK